ncbi:bifunctional uridylyltransferase/uridylyl-removing protein GlnD [Zophobihabitans entericus]|uniref:Bifunctional uridylyltransferase/uridylyl-removing enzyme n=1 Tax=Zophobihabitans entericus TaxID=1635327 RepID=A0A6G9IEJ8_9GAMM|nr:bifunctional uridylyltransferase/uridylyl-removing protein GlnD [Zophobihabitans entericus]QIQ22242.1 bifunctional uridylyltransferase/uridylyl-removing protein GlnD [Zophobihabitans entericus]
MSDSSTMFTYTPLPSHFTDEQLTLPMLKQQLDTFTQWSVEQFKHEMPIETLILGRSQYIDELLQRLWQHSGITQQAPNNRLALIAVGGYGRQELHPLSDIDLLILSDKPLNPEQEHSLSKLISLLWDLRLNVGHSVRTLLACQEEATADLTVMTNLIESRLLSGDSSLLDELHQIIFSDAIWPSPTFFRAKIEEQTKRHKQYHSTSYNLEPDIKNSPGGLRDIQTIQWIAIRHFGGISLEEIKPFNYLTDEEIEEFKNCRAFLWRMRFALHSVITRYDNRLLFDRQLSIAHLLGYLGDGNEPVEKMMHDYYRVVHNITELNQMLLQLFDESILALNPNNKPYDIDEYFQIRDGLIDIKDERLFQHNPTMILRLFNTMVRHPEVKGIYSNTIRCLRSARRQLTGLLCEQAEARQCFLAIIKHPQAIKKALLPMHELGILAVYIPGWQHICGLMQFDLFHAYTVDEHTIRLLQEIDSFTTDDGKKRHPTSSKAFSELPKPELLIIAALFHDIAKGRSGDHSELGAIQVAEFCQLHNLDEKDTHLVVWLVKYHLVMSVTAQSRDIQDPAVMREFTQLVKNKNRLQYLLCLTVADVCATNETLWNSWKQSLMRELYHLTLHYFDLGINQIPEQRSIARQHKRDALVLLAEQGISEESVQRIWQSCRFDYFLRYTADQLVWHAIHLLKHDLSQTLVLINSESCHGGTEIFIYSPDRPYLFAAVSNELDVRNLNIHEALIITNKDGFALDTFIVLEPSGRIVDTERHLSIKEGLEKVLRQTHFKRKRIRRTSSKLKSFQVPTQVTFLSTVKDRKTYIELVALDRPGLLACIGEVFAKLELSLHSAKIITIGEQVEDLFILTDKNNNALDDKLCLALRDALINAIDEMD